MKRKISFSMLLSFSVFAASPLVEDYKNRKNKVFTANEQDIFTFIKSLGRKTETIDELELLNKNGKFLFREAREVCFGDVQTKHLECYNPIGVQTFFEAGDSD